MYEYFGGFGAGETSMAVPKLPFWQLPTREERVATAVKGIQRTFGLTMTGVWNKETHDALFGWFHNYELTVEIPRERAAGRPGHETPLPSWGAPNPEQTAGAALDILDAVDEDPVLGPALQAAAGIPTQAERIANPRLEDGKERGAAELLAHITAKEAEAAGAVGAAAAEKKGLSTTALIAIIGGVLVFGGLFGYGLMASAKPKAAVAPAPAA